jgi:hypothetical protein
MMLWARLTWQAADPVALATDLGQRLGIELRPGGLVAGASLLDLGTAVLEVRPWIREGPADRPTPWGRLVLEPVTGGEDPPGGGVAAPEAAGPGGRMAEGGRDTRGGLRLVAVGWATIDLDRAEDELDPWIGPALATGRGDGEDAGLGARVRLRQAGSLPGDWLAFLEPSTEGRAAASLARDGEGPCALYLRPAGGLDAWLADAAERGVTVRKGLVSPGPLGRQAVLASGPAAGPHLVVVERGVPASTGSGASTIGP